MKVTIQVGRATGRLTVPTSKSVAHRLLICAGLAHGRSVIHGISDCEDVQATLDCLRAIGAECRQTEDTVEIFGVSVRDAEAKGILCTRESGSTLRFLIPVLLFTKAPATFEGYGRLMERPMKIYEDICRERGLLYEKNGQRLTVGGGLPSGTYRLAGDVSSQFISGLLFALPLADGDSVIELIPPVESRSYILMTLDAMRTFGVVAEWERETRISVKGGQRYLPRELTVEGDYSNAAFPDALNFLGCSVQLDGLRKESLQGDRCYRKMMEALHAGWAALSLADCPDLGPILFALAAARHGGRFTGTRRLRIKESDRVAAMQEELAKLGVRMQVGEDEVEIFKADLHRPSEPINGHNDHRIVMSMAILLTLTGGEIEGAEAVKKSYPAFFRDLKRLGILVSESE